MDIWEPDSGPGNTPEYSVSEISIGIRRMLEDSYSHVRVRGEVGRVVLSQNGHLYFDLKDENSVINSVCWRSNVGRLQTRPEEGMEIVVTGKVTAYQRGSRYQLNVEKVELAGEGALLVKYERLKEKLREEGLFDEVHKKPIPKLPKVIGVVTSPSGAAIQDILHRIQDRFPRQVYLWPVATQGENCPAEVTAAIRGFNRLQPGGLLPPPDVLIVTRGGGSFEDLLGFSDEGVVRAAFESGIPLISAVGHEIDFMLIDFAADVRAPTPSAAAEFAVPRRDDLASHVMALSGRMVQARKTASEWRRQRLEGLAKSLRNPEALLENPRQHLDQLSGRLPHALRSKAQRSKLELYETSRRFKPETALEPFRVGSESAGRELMEAFSALMAYKRKQFADSSSGIRKSLLSNMLRLKRERLESLARSFKRAAGQNVKNTRDRLNSLERLRDSLGYTKTLQRGFAVVRSKSGALGSVEEARAEPSLEIEFRDGRLPVVPGK